MDETFYEEVAEIIKKIGQKGWWQTLKMKIIIGSDHRGFVLKQDLIAFLTKKGHQVTDVGTHSEDSCDYPVFAGQVARAVSAKNSNAEF
jgi:ribose-5-phosphate isomerase (EC 5.3.1.6)